MTTYGRQGIGMSTIDGNSNGKGSNGAAKAPNGAGGTPSKKREGEMKRKRTLSVLAQSQPASPDTVKTNSLSLAKEGHILRFNIDKLYEKAMSGKFMTLDEDLFLATTVQTATRKGDKATDKERRDAEIAKEVLYTANLKLVNRMASRMYKASPNTTTMEDCVQEGFAGMQHALNMFDVSKRNKFSTYATWWIRQFIQRHAYNSTRLTAAPVSKVKKCKAVDSKLAKMREEGKAITPRVLVECLDAEGLTVSDYNRTKLFGGDASSLDVPVFRDGGNTGTVGDVIDQTRIGLSSLAETEQVDPLDDVIEKERVTKVLTAARKLPENEREIIEIMYSPTAPDNDKDSEMLAREMLGIGRNEFTKRWTAAIRHLRNALAQDYAGLDALPAKRPIREAGGKNYA